MEMEPAGPVHEGSGWYDLKIERVSDDCTPPFITGEIGQVSVLVRTSGDPGPQQGLANIPLYGSGDPSLAPGRTDISLSEPLVYDRILPECSAASEHHEIQVLLADSTGIHVEWNWTTGGIETCDPRFARAMHDCTSHRILRFRWLRACAPTDNPGCL